MPTSAHSTPISISKAALHSPQLKSVYTEYDQLIKARNLAVKGKGMYQLYVKEFLLWLEDRGIRSLPRISSSLMVEYLDYLMQRPKKKKGSGTLSSSSINQHLFSLRMLVDYLLEAGRISSAVLIPKNNPGCQQERTSLSQDEIRELYAHAKGKRERAILSIAYGCGLRRAEAEALNTNDLNFSNGILVVREGKGKKRRDVPMSDAVIRDLRSYLVEERVSYLKESNYLEIAFFLNNKGKRMHGDHMNEVLKEVVGRTSNPGLQRREVSLHSLRHSVAEHMLGNGADLEFIRDFLGHENIDTSHIYARKRKQRQEATKRKRSL